MKARAELQGATIRITGIVQGVGFRPFIFGLAKRFAINGWVRNTSAGVDIEVDGSQAALEAFSTAIRAEAPPLAKIDHFECSQHPANGFATFEILHSTSVPGAFQPVSPDVSVCPDCLAELQDPFDRRYRYPFTNCTNCGPRFTIIKDIPYDRPNTTMADFPMCPDCQAEYNDPLNRRFHAQPVACPECGPRVWLQPSPCYQTDAQSRLALTGEAAMQTVRSMLRQGQIVAIKGLGGFHLACDATNPQAVEELRRRKGRVDKAFALMMPDLATVEKYCQVSAADQRLLAARQRPVVILPRQPQTSKSDQATICPEVAPGQATLGVMLPYTPLHMLLFWPAEANEQPPAQVLVMTSGNLSEEPIATDNAEALQRLAPLADAFLLHDRPIYIRCDDSVVRSRIWDGDLAPNQADNTQDMLFLRRGRGYAPEAIWLPWELPPGLAGGAELKNTFALGRGPYAFLSHHIGDMENFETLQSFECGVDHFERLFHIQPQMLAYDLHPDYLATRYILDRAEREHLPACGVQHHHAHIAAGMAEHGLPADRSVIGVAFDGTGYGEDGAIWGGEILIASYAKYQRWAHLAYVPLPGGDAAVRKPARVALAHLWQAGIDWDPALPPVAALCAEERQVVRTQLERGLNAPPTSSLGRLFDAVSALAGVRQSVNYEAQAAIELEALVDPDERGSYAFELHTPPVDENIPVAARPTKIIDPAPLLHALVHDVLAGVQPPILATRFHHALTALVVEVCAQIRQATGLQEVVLSGGVWQNTTLLASSYQQLRAAGFLVYDHRRTPPNDGGLALGQLAVAFHRLAS